MTDHTIRAYSFDCHTVTTNAGSVEASHEAAGWKFEVAGRVLPRIGAWVQRKGTNNFFWSRTPALFA